MKKLWLLLAIAVLLQTTCAQEVKHVPTFEQCRADHRLWFAKLTQRKSGGIASVSFVQLRDWGIEMAECKDVDPERTIDYSTTNSIIQSKVIMRFNNFLARHHLYDQFLAEDAQGKGR